MGGAATVVCLQQLKGILGLVHFTHGTDLVSVMRSIFTQTHQWRWESGVLGCCFLFFLLLTKYFVKQKETSFLLDKCHGTTNVRHPWKCLGLFHPC
nr:sulfate transporter 3.1 [Ipomoea batatas]GME09713.1 sulfate transporter 3.1 [Ipomoea batatas]